MKKVVLSRKYRPKKISDVIGQDFAVKTIKNAFELDKLAHAFLLTGIRGVGKTTIARIIAMGLNCVSVKKPSPDPCNQCNNCKEIIEDRFDEVLELDAASHTSVDDIREIISYVKYRPTKGRYKVFVIDEVHMLSNSAFNALLKTVEEPPDYVKFIFCTTEINKIPITILSRCQKFQLHRVSKEKIILNLKKIVEEGEVKELGIKLVNLSDEIRIRQNIPDDIYGLLVLNVEQNSEAERKGIRPGDIIQEINQVPVNKISELKAVVKKSSDKKGILLLVNRQGNIIFIALKSK